MKVRITPNPFLNQGTCERTLAEIGVGPVLSSGGKIRCQMTQAQLDLFGIRGASHQVEILPDSTPDATTEQPPAVEPAPVEVQPAFEPSIIIETPTGRQTVKMPETQTPAEPAKKDEGTKPA